MITYVLLGIVTLYLLTLICQMRIFSNFVYRYVNQAIVIMDKRFRIVSLNEQAATLSGQPSRYLIGQPFVDLFPEQQRALVTSILNKELNHNKFRNKEEFDFFNESRSICRAYFNLMTWRREIVFTSRDPFLNEHTAIQRIVQTNQNYQKFVLTSFKHFDSQHEFVWNFLYELQGFFQYSRVFVLNIASGQIVYDTNENGHTFTKTSLDHLVNISGQGIGIVTVRPTEEFAPHIYKELKAMQVNYQLSRIVNAHWLLIAQKNYESSMNVYLRLWEEFENHIFFHVTFLFESKIKEHGK